MDSRQIQQINKTISVGYCCVNDVELSLCDDCDDIGKFLGYEVSASNRSICSLVLYDELSITRKTISDQLKTNGQVELLMPLVKNDQSIVWVLNRGTLVKDGETEYIVGTLTQATLLKLMFDEQKRAAEHYMVKLSQTENMVNILQAKAEQDSLTKLFNASTTRAMCEDYIAERTGNCALMIIDIDDFKEINDNCGHLVGDIVLMHVADVIKKLFRSLDIVGRIGGDEFLVLMKDVPSSSIVLKRCEQIVQSVCNIEYKGLKQGSIHCSVGLALSESESETYDHLFLRADSALYKAKGQGKNGFVIALNE